MAPNQMKNFDLKIDIMRQFGTQKAFAEEAGLTTVQVSNVLHGRSFLSPESARRWEKLLGSEIWSLNRLLRKTHT